MDTDIGAFFHKMNKEYKKKYDALRHKVTSRRLVLQDISDILRLNKNTTNIWHQRKIARKPLIEAEILDLENQIIDLIKNKDDL